MDVRACSAWKGILFKFAFNFTAWNPNNDLIYVAPVIFIVSERKLMDFMPRRKPDVPLNYQESGSRVMHELTPASHVTSPRTEQRVHAENAHFTRQTRFIFRHSFWDKWDRRPFISSYEKYARVKRPLLY